MEGLDKRIEEVAAALEEHFSHLYSLVEGESFKGNIDLHRRPTSLEIKKGKILIGCRSVNWALGFPHTGLRFYDNHYTLKFSRTVTQKPKLRLGEWDWGMIDHIDEYSPSRFLKIYAKKKDPDTAFGLAREYMKLPKIVLETIKKTNSKDEKASREILGELEAISRQFKASVDYPSLYVHDDEKFKSFFQKMEDGEKIVVLRHIFADKLRNLEADEWLGQNYPEIVRHAGRDNYLEEELE